MFINNCSSLIPSTTLPTLLLRTTRNLKFLHPIFHKPTKILFFLQHVFFAQLSLQQINNMVHLLTIRFQTNNMIVHLPKLHYLIILEIFPHNYLHLLIQLLQIIPIRLQQLLDPPDKRRIMRFLCPLPTPLRLRRQVEQITPRTMITAVF